MSSSRDLLEAQRWARRRLLAAYLSGDPDERPRGQVRAALAGIGVAGVVVGAVAAWSYLAP